MPAARRFYNSLTAILLLTSAASSAAFAQVAGEVRVELASGRILAGQVDPRTDSETLWLRSVRGSDQSRTVVRRPIQWSRVVAADVGDRQFSGVEFQRVANELQTSLGVIARRDVPATAVEVGPTPRDDRFNGQPAKIDGAVRTLSIEACLGHWNAAAETSGIVVVIRPLDAWGQLTPIDGTLEVDLVGEQPVNGRQGDVFPRIGRWTQSVSVDDFGPDGARYELPFQAVHPDFERDLGHLGLLHARLAAPGHGVFDASVEQLRIRPYSAIRDRAESNRGSRFFPVEQTGRGKRYDGPPRP